MNSDSSPIRIAIAGLGRSGWNIHAAALEQLPDLFLVGAVMDLDPARRQEAVERFGCRAYDDYAALIADDQVEAIVIATPNFLHKDHVIAALKNGKHAICEKPFGLDSSEADAMIEAAQKADKLVAPFQNRRYEPHFLKVKEVIQSGVLGEVHLIRIAWHGFKRRWDWQTLSEFGGGDLSNTGPHVIDHALQLLGAAEPQVLCDLRNVLSSGDTEDHIKITLRAPGAPVVDVELTSASAFPQDRWLVLGDAGALRGTPNHLEWKWVDWSQHPRREAERQPTSDRSYNREELQWQHAECETSEGYGEVALQFYRDFYASAREGAPQFISPQSVRRVIALIEECKTQAPTRQGRFASTSQAK